MPRRKKVDPTAPLEVGPVGVSVMRSRGQNREGLWYWRARHAGRTVWTGRATREGVAAAVGTLVAQGKHLETPGRDEPVERFLRDLLWGWFNTTQKNRRDCTESTRATYKTRVRRIEVRIGNRPPLIDTATLIAYRDIALQGESALATRSVAEDLRLLSEVCRWACEKGLQAPVILRKPKLKIRPVRNRRTPTETEAVMVLDWLDGHAPFWVARLARLLYCTGCRIGEVEQLSWGSWDPSAGVLLVDGKTGVRAIPVSTQLRGLLSAWRPHGGEEPTLILGIRRGQSAYRSMLHSHLTRACAELGIQPFSPQGLRRLMSDRIFDAGFDPGIEAALLGHSPTVALRHYRTVSARRAAEAMAAVSGKVLAFQAHPRGTPVDDIDECG